LEESVKFLNSLAWMINWEQDGEQWKAFAGEGLLVDTHTKQELEAFILGMTIGLAVLPKSMLDDIRKLVAE
jgi:hypothetical protein